MKTKIKNLILRFHYSNSDRDLLMNQNLFDHDRCQCDEKEDRTIKTKINHTQQGIINTGIR